jgi:hypothetical protein
MVSLVVRNPRRPSEIMESFVRMTPFDATCGIAGLPNSTMTVNMEPVARVRIYSLAAMGGHIQAQSGT